MLKQIYVISLVALGVTSTLAQTAIPVGAGSYASSPPASAGGTALATATQSLYVVSSNSLPVPSNKWWTDLVVHQYSGFLWAYPLTVSADAQGINIFNPDWGIYDGGHAFMGVNYQPVSPISIRGQGFSPADARALRWGDWTLSFRMQETANELMDVTLGQGLPFVWAQFTGVAPQIISSNTATYFRTDGGVQTFPVTTNVLGITYAGRNYGVFAPDNTSFTFSSDRLNVTFAGTNTYLVIGALPAKSNLAYFAQYAHALPTNSQMNWSYDPAAGAVTTRWHLATHALTGVQTNTIQGWIPHHWRNANDFVFNGMEYSVARGRMKCTTGTDFQIVYRFNGLLPTLPAPALLGGPNDYDPARMNGYIAGVSSSTAVAGETYAGGLDMLRYAQHMNFAHALGRPEFGTLQNTLRAALTNWLTYTPGDGKYFAYYPSWKGLTGFPASYGSDQFNDHHFHYGYFTYTSALLGMFDRNFLANYGPMARLVAKEYANWERGDTNFPFLRTFDIWGGHSDASGFSSTVKGNNQESSSEAMQSWGGLFMLGAVLGDDEMRAAGAMGYAMESEGVRQYWFNVPKFYNASDGNWPASYTKPAVGILWDSGQEYQTYFGADPLFIHGIQWLPPSPLLNYLVTDPAFAQQDYNNMMAQRGNTPVSGMSSQWGNVALSYAGMFNPDYTAAQMDQLWAASNPIATDVKYAGVTYYQTHATRRLGAIQWGQHLSVPTSAVYYNTNSGLYSYVAYNPLTNAQVATVYSNQVPIGTLLLPPLTLVSVNTLAGNGGGQTNVVASLVERGVEIRWPTLAQSNYVVQAVPELPANTSWTNLTDPVPGNGATNRWFDPVNPDQRKFYRVLQSP